MNLSAKRWFSILVVLMLLLGVMLSVSAQEQSYTVQSGDTVQSIASRFSVTTDALLQYNGIIDPNRIVRGQVLKIPTGVVTPPQTHLVQPGESLQWIAERYNVTLESLIAANDITDSSRLTVGRVLQLPATGGPSIFTREHIVQPGQTLRAIAEMYGTTWENLASVNNLANPNFLQVGQSLIVPAFGAPATTPTPVPTQQPAPVVTPVPTTAPPQTTLRTYVVRVGDNPSLIADRFGVTLSSLIDLNNLRGNLPIFAGDVLLIPPTGGTVGTVPATSQGATAPGTHVVQPGETLFSIAQRYGRNIYDIAARNGLLNLNTIYIGQSLAIP